MNMSGEAEGLLFTFLDLTLDVGDWTASHSDCVEERKTLKGLRIMLRFEHRPYQVQSDGASQLVAVFICKYQSYSCALCAVL
jgi:hypothetical protein